MAMAICSSSKHSPTLPNISISSNYSTKTPFLKLSSNYGSPLMPHTHSSSNHVFCSAVQEEEAVVISGVGIQQLAAESTREAVRILERKWIEIGGERERLCSEVRVTRKRRRRKALKNDEDDEYVFVDKKGGKRFMTAKEEARFTWYLKEKARIEALRRELVANMGGQEVSSIELAKAAGISRRNLDRILCNGRKSEERITKCYHGLVVSIASSYQGKGLSFQDLTQEGSIGLLHGATKFNPERGYKLSTYCYWWIRQAIARAVAKKAKLIRLPGSINEVVPKICEANTVLSRKLRRFPTYEEIAEAIDVKPSVVRLAMERSRCPISLDQAITSHGCMSLKHILPGPDEMTPEAMVKKEILKPEIENLLQALCDREASILRLHHGLNGDTPWSFEEIGRLFNLSRERVRQLNSAALSKLRQLKDIDDLKYFV